MTSHAPADKLRDVPWTIDRQPAFVAGQEDTHRACFPGNPNRQLRALPARRQTQDANLIGKWRVLPKSSTLALRSRCF